MRPAFTQLTSTWQHWTSSPRMPQFGQGPLWPESTDHGKAGIKTGWGQTKEEAQCCALEQMRDGLTDNSHLALSSQVNFSFISHSFVYFFFYILKVILSHFIVTVHLLPPQWQPKKTGITLFKRETEAERCLISAHRQQKERKNKEGKGKVRRRGNRAGAARCSSEKEGLAAQRMVLLLFF